MSTSSRKPSLKELHFAALAVDIVCFRVRNGVLEVLLGKVLSQNTFHGKWAHIGGLIAVSETAEQAAERLLRDKAGIKDIYMEQLCTFSAVKRDPRGRVVSVAYIALAEDDTIQNLEQATVPTEWRPISRVTNLGYDHDEIARVALHRLRSKIIYTDIARHLIAPTFTLSDLQKVYEAVLGKGMDKRNFRKKMLSLGILKDTKRTVKKGVMRPAALYTFKPAA
jgi:8-oxo-dGTP diphosphatase